MTGPYAWLLDRSDQLRDRLDAFRLRRRLGRLRQRGMRIGERVVFPASTWIDVSHCYLISIGDDCVFGPDCLILAHDAQMDEFLDVARIGRVAIHEGCSFGPLCVVLCNVEVGPRTVVAPGSVVATSLPPDTYCAGAPARVVSSLAEYVDARRAEMASLPTYGSAELARLCATPGGRADVRAALGSAGGFVRSGRG